MSDDRRGDSVGPQHSAPGRADAGVRRPRRAKRRGGRVRLDVLAVIAAGGMLGASARYGVARWLPTRPGHFPWATFWTNLSGSFVLGFVLVLLLERFPPTRYWRPFLATGILGAFTTMSSYAVETTVLLKDGHVATGLAYGLGSVLAGLALAYAGMRMGRLTPARQHRPGSGALKEAEA